MTGRSMLLATAAMVVLAAAIWLAVRRGTELPHAEQDEQTKERTDQTMRRAPHSQGRASATHPALPQDAACTAAASAGSVPLPAERRAAGGKNPAARNGRASSVEVATGPGTDVAMAARSIRQAVELIAREHPDISPDDLALARIRMRGTGPGDRQEGRHADLVFREVSSTREEAVGDLTVSQFNAVRVLLSASGELLRGRHALTRAAAISARPRHASGELRSGSFFGWEAPVEVVLQEYMDAGGAPVQEYAGPSLSITAFCEEPLTEEQKVAFLKKILSTHGLVLVKDASGALKAVSRAAEAP